jgi:hypothetical protein
MWTRRVSPLCEARCCLRLPPVFDSKPGNPREVRRIAGDQYWCVFQGRCCDDEVGVIMRVTASASLRPELTGTHQDGCVDRKDIARSRCLEKRGQLTPRLFGVQSSDDFVKRDRRK